MTNPFNGAVDLSKLGKEQLKSEVLGHDVVDVLPSERTDIQVVAVEANRLFHSSAFARDYEADPHKALAKYSVTVDNMFHEIGWQVWVDAFNVEVDDNDRPYLSPMINIVGRVEEAEFDFEQAQGEVQNGLLDGQIGRVMEDGTWRAPKTII